MKATEYDLLIKPNTILIKMDITKKGIRYPIENSSALRKDLPKRICSKSFQIRDKARISNATVFFMICFGASIFSSVITEPQSV
jgi:hypothetical protein